jgi:membrane protein implicated in regulation of membrane protease activity
MEYWQILLIAGIIFIIIEIFTPAIFFLNFALAALLTAVISLLSNDLNLLIPVFVFSSIVFILFLRPFLIKSKTEVQQTGLEGKYIGKTAKVTDVITSSSGAISIYNERWEARSNNGEEIPVGVEVKIIRNESLVLYVEKIN